MIAKIDLLDTFFFRDGKPFSQGEETWADSVFPPAPSVLYGMLRSLYMANHKDGFSEDNISRTEDLIIKNIFIEINDQVCFPVPKDFVVNKEDEDDKFLLTLQALEVTSNAKTVRFFSAPRKKANIVAQKVEDNALFNKDDFESYLSLNDIDMLPYYNASDYLISEAKIGIGRSNLTLTSESGLLYRVDMKRLGATSLQKQIDVKMVVEYEGLDLPASFAKLGGEGKSAKVEIQDNAIEVNPPEIDEYFKLYLATPAIFKKGWLPEWIDETTLVGSYRGVEIELLATCLSKAMSIGGFDLKKKEPKPMLKAVPQGSIYYFKILKGSKEQVLKAFHGQTIAEYDFAKQGFGVCYVAKAQ